MRRPHEQLRRADAHTPTAGAPQSDLSGRARLLVERNVIAYRAVDIPRVRFFEPLFYLLSIGLG